MLWHFFEHRSSMEAILAFNSLYPKQITNKKFKHSCERLESSTLKDDSQTDLCSDPAAPGIQLSENSSVVPHLVFRDGNPNPVLPSRSPAFFFDHGIDLRSVGQGRPGQVRSPLASRWRQCSVGFDVGKHSVNYILFLLATMGSSKHISILGTKKKLFQVKLNDITSCYLSEAILVKASLVKQGTTPQTCSNPKRFT